jgi:Flp pilus assembly protein TadG
MQKASRERSRGQALAELAMVAPLFFLMVFGTIDLGRVIWANDTVGNAAREGARFASVHAGALAQIEPATKDDIKQHALDYVIAGGTNASVTVCFTSSAVVASGGAACSGDVDAGTAIYERGNLVTVTVTSQVPIMVGSFFGSGNWSVTGESTVLVNN